MSEKIPLSGGFGISDAAAEALSTSINYHIGPLTLVYTFIHILR